MKSKITVAFEIDLSSLNEHLGNTPNVSIAAATKELLDGLFSRKTYYCERCGSAGSEETGLIGNFVILQE